MNLLSALLPKRNTNSIYKITKIRLYSLVKSPLVQSTSLLLLLLWFLYILVNGKSRLIHPARPHTIIRIIELTNNNLFLAANAKNHSERKGKLGTLAWTFWQWWWWWLVRVQSEESQGRWSASKHHTKADFAKPKQGERWSNFVRKFTKFWRK